MNLLKQIASRLPAESIAALSEPTAPAPVQSPATFEGEGVGLGCVDAGIGKWLALQDEATQERFIERAAIAEFEGGASRIEAERLAFESYGGELGAAGVMAARLFDGSIEGFSSVQD